MTFHFDIVKIHLATWILGTELEILVPLAFVI